jgi:UDP-2,3-diacylglucosamine hydrolase
LGEGTDAEEADKFRRLLGFLREVELRAKTLVLVGDIFDFWYEWKTVLPKRCFGLLCRFQSLIKAGLALHYLPGNHDFRLQGFLEKEMGIAIYTDAQPFQIGEQKIFVFHGDGILKRDSGYRLLKRVLRSRINQRLFSCLHPDIGMTLARTTSRTSRTRVHYMETDEEEYRAFAENQFARGFHGVVLGHSHHPVQVDFPQGTYVNLGDWIRHFSYGIHDGEHLMLHYWQEA